MSTRSINSNSVRSVAKCFGIQSQQPLVKLNAQIASYIANNNITAARQIRSLAESTLKDIKNCSDNPFDSIMILEDALGLLNHIYHLVGKFDLFYNISKGKCTRCQTGSDDIYSNSVEVHYLAVDDPNHRYTGQKYCRIKLCNECLTIKDGRELRLCANCNGSFFIGEQCQPCQQLSANNGTGKPALEPEKALPASSKNGLSSGLSNG